MSIQSELDRITQNIARSYDAVADRGGKVPEQRNSAGLEEAIHSISAVSAPTTPLDPLEVYKTTRPADWLPMPEPADNEMYLLFQIPADASALLAFTVTTGGGLYHVAFGTVRDGVFCEMSAPPGISSGSRFETELFAEDYGDLTSDGFKQVMIKVSGTSIVRWSPSRHSRYSINTNGERNWNIVEISCKLPNGTAVSCGYDALYKLRYFSWIGENALTDADAMFRDCSSLIAVLHLDTSKLTNMYRMFANCTSLIAIPKFDTHNVTAANSMFSRCFALQHIPSMDLSNATTISQMFFECYALVQLPALNTKKATIMDWVFTNCYSLRSVQELNTASVTDIDDTFTSAHALEQFLFASEITGWDGADVSIQNCCFSHAALVNLFNSLPTITSAHTLTLTGNPGVSELTDAEKAIATGKNWTLTL